jgi:hypothetical protein
VDEILTETTILRIFKEVSDAQISQFEALTHILRGQHWRRLYFTTGISPAWFVNPCAVDEILTERV